MDRTRSSLASGLRVGLLASFVDTQRATDCCARSFAFAQRDAWTLRGSLLQLCHFQVPRRLHRTGGQVCGYRRVKACTSLPGHGQPGRPRVQDGGTPEPAVRARRGGIWGRFSPGPLRSSPPSNGELSPLYGLPLSWGGKRPEIEFLSSPPI